MLFLDERWALTLQRLNPPSSILEFPFFVDCHPCRSAGASQPTRSGGIAATSPTREDFGPCPRPIFLSHHSFAALPFLKSFRHSSGGPHARVRSKIKIRF